MSLFTVNHLSKISVSVESSLSNSVLEVPELEAFVPEALVLEVLVPEALVF